MTDIAKIAAHCNVTFPAETKSIKQLETLDIIEEITGKECHKICAYQRYLEILDKGIDEF